MLVEAEQLELEQIGHAARPHRFLFFLEFIIQRNADVFSLITVFGERHVV